MTCHLQQPDGWMFISLIGDPELQGQQGRGGTGFLGSKSFTCFTVSKFVATWKVLGLLEALWMMRCSLTFQDRTVCDLSRCLAYSSEYCSIQHFKVDALLLHLYSLKSVLLWLSEEAKCELLCQQGWVTTWKTSAAPCCARGFGPRFCRSSMSPYRNHLPCNAVNLPHLLQLGWKTGRLAISICKYALVRVRSKRSYVETRGDRGKFCAKIIDKDCIVRLMKFADTSDIFFMALRLHPSPKKGLQYGNLPLHLRGFTLADVQEPRGTTGTRTGKFS